MPHRTNDVERAYPLTHPHTLVSHITDLLWIALLTTASHQKFEPEPDGVPTNALDTLITEGVFCAHQNPRWSSITDSNRQCHLGRVKCYHYTNTAYKWWFSSLPQISMTCPYLISLILPDLSTTKHFCSKAVFF